ncbi:MAG: protein with SnoaL 3 domain, NTF 2 superfamily [Pseudomonadales bacterium]|nr:protein with SnoaL 3 domain, NTF 2 superfamily [Pseudomonadales bacterium]
MKMIFVTAFLFLASNSFAQSVSSELESINTVLDSYHDAASQGDWDRYFDLMSEDGVFLGTDAAERWPKEVFREYAAGRSGWTYHPTDRHVNLTPDGNSAWFDEILDSESYGTSRGTGVLIKTNDGWKISQYHLTFPIPNELSQQMTDAIKAFEAQEN